MDIFTTQLAKVAPNKIETDKLKIKAIAKEARLHEIKEDVQELDPEASKKHDQEQPKEDKKTLKDEEENLDSSGLDKDGHLDIYV